MRICEKLTSEVNGCGVGTALRGGGLDRVSGVVASTGGARDGAPLGDDGSFPKGNDGVLLLQPPVWLQHVQPAFASTTVHILQDDRKVKG